MKRVIQNDGDLTKLARLDYFIRRNFKKNVPDEASWSTGAFRKMKLTQDFYESETAARVFGKIFGIKNCAVNLNKDMPQTVSFVLLKFDQILVTLDKIWFPLLQIDLTQSVRVGKGDSRKQSSDSDMVEAPSDDDDPIEQVRPTF